MSAVEHDLGREIGEPDYDVIQRALPLLRLMRSYFRGQTIGLHHIPDGPALLVGNHNAGITMFEPFMLGLEWYQRDGANNDPIHFLGHDAMLKLPAVGLLLKKAGVIRAHPAVAGAALAMGRKVMVFPGGNYEAFRPYAMRHQVDFKGRVGFARLALQHRVPIVPVLSFGGHETFFVLRRGQRLARWSGAKRFFRSDSFPLFLGLPWGVGVGPLFHLPLPAKLEVEVGQPISVEQYGPDAASDPRALAELSDRVQTALQDAMKRRAAARRFPIFG